MGRLIDADVLKQDLTRFYDNEVTAKQLIDEQPTVYAEPVRMGEWIVTVSNEIHCSKCGCKPPKYWNDEHADDFTVLTNYCPNCGVLMYTEGI